MTYPIVGIPKKKNACHSCWAIYSDLSYLGTPFQVLYPFQVVKICRISDCHQQYVMALDSNKKHAITLAWTGVFLQIFTVCQQQTWFLFSLGEGFFPNISQSGEAFGFTFGNLEAGEQVHPVMCLGLVHKVPPKNLPQKRSWTIHPIAKVNWCRLFRHRGFPLMPSPQVLPMIFDVHPQKIWRGWFKMIPAHFVMGDSLWKTWIPCWPRVKRHRDRKRCNPLR